MEAFLFLQGQMKFGIKGAGGLRLLGRFGPKTDLGPIFSFYQLMGLSPIDFSGLIFYLFPGLRGTVHPTFPVITKSSGQKVTGKSGVIHFLLRVDFVGGLPRISGTYLYGIRFQGGGRANFATINPNWHFAWDSGLQYYLLLSVSLPCLKTTIIP